MGEHLAGRVHQSAFGGRDLPTGMNDGADSLKRTDSSRDRTDEVDLDLERRIAHALWQQRMHGASEARVEHCCRPAAVDDTERIVVADSRLAFKHCPSGPDLDKSKTKGDRHRRWRIATVQHALQQLEAGLPRDFIPGYETGAGRRGRSWVSAHLTRRKAGRPPGMGDLGGGSD